MAKKPVRRKKKAPEKTTDWQGIAADYIAGQMGNREIARWYGISETAIRKRAKLEGWERAKEPGHVVREPAPSRLTDPGVSPADLGDRARVLASRMMDELDAVTSLHGELEDMICAEESDPRRRQALLRSLSLGERAKTLKDISQTIKTVGEAAPQGKKAQRQASAEQVAASGKFAPRTGPRLAVSNV